MSVGGGRGSTRSKISSIAAASVVVAGWILESCALSASAIGFGFAIATVHGYTRLNKTRIRFVRGCKRSTDITISGCFAHDPVLCDAQRCSKFGPSWDECRIEVAQADLGAN